MTYDLYDAEAVTKQNRTTTTARRIWNLNMAAGQITPFRPPPTLAYARVQARASVHSRTRTKAHTYTHTCPSNRFRRYIDSSIKTAAADVVDAASEAATTETTRKLPDHELRWLRLRGEKGVAIRSIVWCRRETPKKYRGTSEQKKKTPRKPIINNKAREHAEHVGRVSARRVKITVRSQWTEPYAPGAASACNNVPRARPGSNSAEETAETPGTRSRPKRTVVVFTSSGFRPRFSSSILFSMSAAVWTSVVAATVVRRGSVKPKSDDDEGLRSGRVDARGPGDERG